MKKLISPIFQIAGVHDWAEVEILRKSAARAGVDQLDLGLPLGPGLNSGQDLTLIQARELVAQCPDAISAVVITYLTEPEEVLALCGSVGARKVQLHGPATLVQIQKLRERDPALFIIKSLIVGVTPLLELNLKVKELSPFVDAFITDTYDPRSGASGATGQTHNWQISRELVLTSQAQPLKRPLILAGGLGPDNVAKAISATQPQGVDAHTRLEGHDGRKDFKLVTEFLSRARQAFSLLNAVE